MFVVENRTCFAITSESGEVDLSKPFLVTSVALIYFAQHRLFWPFRSPFVDREPDGQFCLLWKEMGGVAKTIEEFGRKSASRHCGSK